MTMRFGIDSDGWLYKLNAADGTPALHVRPLPQATTQPRILPWMWINHTQAASNQGSFQAAWNWWTSTASGGGEAHTVTNMDGEITQFMPFTRRADCSYKANSFFVEHDGQQVLAGALSDEAQDEGWGPGKPGTLCAYSPAQLETKAQVLAATHIKYGIPLDQVPPGPFDRGIGWHRLHAQWSKYVGKSCPGDARVDQQPELRARAQQIVAGGHPVVIPPTLPPTSEEDDMIIVDYGYPGVDPWWTRMYIAGGTIGWVQGKAQQWTEPGTGSTRRLDELAKGHIQVENDQHMFDLLATFKANTACPSTFTSNATLVATWTASKAR